VKGSSLIVGCVCLLALCGCAATAPAQGRGSGPVFSNATAGVVDFDRRVYRVCRQAVHDERMAAIREQKSKAQTPLKRIEKLRLEN
jgi:hypothetical protein